MLELWKALGNAESRRYPGCYPMNSYPKNSYPKKSYPKNSNEGELGVIVMVDSIVRCAMTLLLTAAMTGAFAAEDRATAEVVLESAVDERALQLARDVTRYRESVTELEANGAWYGGLSQELMGLGAILQRQGDHEEALLVFERAGHLMRVNLGLYALEQVASLNQRVISHVSLGQWQEADELQQYKFMVHLRSLERDDPAFIPVLEELAVWSMSAFYQRLGEFPSVRLVDAYRLYAAAHRLTELHYPRDFRRQLELLDGLAGAAYVGARVNANFTAASYPNARAFNERGLLATEDLQTYHYRSNGYEQGQFALQQAIGIHESMPAQHYDAEAHAEAYARLGDWYLLFDRRQAATEAYRQAWFIMAEEGPEVAQRFFAQVQVLPQFRNLGGPRIFSGNRAGGLDQGYVDVNFDINSYGRVINMGMVAVEPSENVSQANRIMRELRNTRMRPHFSDAEPTTASGVSLRVPYRFRSDG
jgi:tetratricopeptide (TPR) repeat protein